MINLEPNKFYNDGKRDLLYLGDIGVTGGNPAVDDTFSQFMYYYSHSGIEDMALLDVDKNKISDKGKGRIDFPEGFPNCTYTGVRSKYEPQRFKELKRIYEDNLEKTLGII